jgi:hypothetical protein
MVRGFFDGEKLESIRHESYNMHAIQIVTEVPE